MLPSRCPVVQKRARLELTPDEWCDHGSPVGYTVRFVCLTCGESALSCEHAPDDQLCPVCGGVEREPCL